MTTETKHMPVVWRISDGRSGHDSQSKGLLEALMLIKPCDCYEIMLTGRKLAGLDFLFKRFPPGERLPSPDIIIGSGHHTHLSMLCAQRARGGKTIVIMKPSLPADCFDLCIIPEHDNPKVANNIFTTKGAINCITPAEKQADDRGLILIGGPSKHFYWDNDYLLQQLNEILGTHKEITWKITDSPRTPETTKQSLLAMQTPNADYINYQQTDDTWVARQLHHTASVWVSADSVSMIYESLTSGAAVGLLDVPAHGKSKLNINIAGLVEDKMVTPYNKWLDVRKLEKPPVLLNEARRCAEHLYASGLLH